MRTRELLLLLVLQHGVEGFGVGSRRAEGRGVTASFYRNPFCVATTSVTYDNNSETQQQQFLTKDGDSAMEDHREEDRLEEVIHEDPELVAMERAWRYAKKPLLSIGSKGATLTHGNSLRQLLQQHTVVKVKVNTRRFNNSLQEAFLELRSLAEENGAPANIEFLQARESDHVILFGWPGTRKRILNDQFPLPPLMNDD